MECKDFINSIENGCLTYRGRAMAFYENGRDYGIVTILSAKTSHHIVTSHACFIYSETTQELIGTTTAEGHVNQELFVVKTASCGRKYVLTCNDKDKQLIYIGMFF